MKKGRYVVTIEDDGEMASVEVLGGISPEEVAQLFGFCVCTLLDFGTTVEWLKEGIDSIKEEHDERKV